MGIKFIEYFNEKRNLKISKEIIKPIFCHRGKGSCDNALKTSNNYVINFPRFRVYPWSPQLFDI